MLIAATELKGVDKLVVQFRMLTLDKGGKEVVAPVLQKSPHY